MRDNVPKIDRGGDSRAAAVRLAFFDGRRTDLKWEIQLTFNLAQLNLCLMVSPVGRAYCWLKQPGRGSLWRGIVWLPDGFAQPHPPPH
jgi:hypothetical protein